MDLSTDMSFNYPEPEIGPYLSYSDRTRQYLGEAHIFNLAATSKVYSFVKSHFETGVPNCTILSIKAVWQPLLWAAFCNTVNRIAAKMPKKDADVRWGWHGTADQYIKNIAARGFRRECTTTQAYGAGVYFAHSSSYSANDRYSKPDKQGNQHMFLAKMCCGKIIAGNSSIMTPTTDSDTLADNTSNPSVYVMQHDNQAYPMYIVTFRKTN